VKVTDSNFCKSR